MKPITKADLLAQIENAKNNYILGLSAISVLSEPFATQHLEKSQCAFGKYVLDLHQVAILMTNDRDRKIAFTEFTNMLVRGLLKESFEVVKAYAKSTQQSAMLEAQPWFVFFRLVRNCVSHNFHFQFGRFDRDRLPVSWNGRTIDTSFHNQPMEIAFLGYDGVWDLFSELMSFAEGRLK